jgi:Zn-dependent protease
LKEGYMVTSGVSLGKVFGISIRLHYSWFFVFVLITWALVAGYLADNFPDWPLSQAVVVGVITSLLFFASVLTHELAHSLVARNAGIPIDSITLFIFGGVSTMTDEPRRPGVEFRVAVAGPLTSVAIGALSFIVLGLTINASEPVAAMAFWLGWINIALAIFNLVPGFPLDGGRVLRSIIWWRTRDLRASTKTASTIGRAIGFLFIFIGIFMIFWGYWLNGLWLAFIGWFLENAAVGSYRQVALKDILEGHTARELMSLECSGTPPGVTLDELVNRSVLDTGSRCFLVTEDGRIRGLVTMHNVKAVPRSEWPTTTVGEAMIPFDKVKRVSPQEDLASVLRLMNEEDINQVPVVEGDNVLGMVTRDRVLNFIDTRAQLGM